MYRISRETINLVCVTGLDGKNAEVYADHQEGNGRHDGRSSTSPTSVNAVSEHTEDRIRESIEETHQHEYRADNGETQPKLRVEGRQYR